MIYRHIYSRAINYLHCFKVYISAPYGFDLSYYYYIMVRFLIKDTFGGQALIKRRRFFSSDCEMLWRLFETRHLQEEIQ